MVANAAQRARHLKDPTGDDCPTEVGASVAGQAFTAFLLGVRARCRAGDISQVAFVARDGLLFHLMAQAMDANLWSGIDLHYLHGNRLTWALAGARTLGLEQWMTLGRSDNASYLLHGQQDRTPRMLLARLGLSPDDVPTGHPLGEVPPDEPLGNAADAWDQLLDQVSPDTAIGQLVNDRADERHQLSAAYLSTLGLRPGPVLLVDVGWRGQSAIAVSPIFADVLGSEPIHYHFGGVGVQPEIDALGRIERYAFDDGVAPAPFGDMVCCVEMFTGAGKPRALRYTTDASGSVVPVFDRGVPEMASGDRDRLWAAATATAAALPSAELRASFDDTVPDPSGILEALRLFWQAPTPDQAALGARLNIEVDEIGKRVLPVAAPYSFGELRQRQPRRWREGSQVLSPATVRVVFGALQGARSGLRHLNG